MSAECETLVNKCFSRCWKIFLFLLSAIIFCSAIGAYAVTRTNEALDASNKLNTQVVSHEAAQAEKEKTVIEKLDQIRGDIRELREEIRTKKGR